MKSLDLRQPTLSENRELAIKQSIELALPGGAIFTENIVFKRALRIASAFHPETESKTVEEVVESLIQEGKLTRVSMKGGTYLERGITSTSY